MGWLLVLQRLLAQDVAEEDPDERHPPQELQLLGDQGHGLVEAGARAGSMGVSAPPDGRPPGGVAACPLARQIGPKRGVGSPNAHPRPRCQSTELLLGSCSTQASFAGSSPTALPRPHRQSASQPPSTCLRFILIPSCSPPRRQKLPNALVRRRLHSWPRSRRGGGSGGREAGGGGDETGMLCLRTHPRVTDWENQPEDGVPVESGWTSSGTRTSDSSRASG